MTTRRIGVYGGSFDPPHRAHVELVKRALGTSEVDDVIVVPVYEHALQKKTTPFEARVALTRIAFAECAQVDVSAIEADLPRPSYTLHTLEALARLYPEASLRLLVGADVLSELERWHRIDEVRALAPLLLFGRRGVAEAGAPEPVLPEISSTRVREELRRRRPDLRSELLEEWLPPKVLSEIERRGLYL